MLEGDAAISDQLNCDKLKQTKCPTEPKTKWHSEDIVK